MSAPFPFDFPGPTAFYLTLYVLTFALHQAVMHYVLAGSAVVAWTMIFPGRGPVPRGERPAAAMLRDWMPFMLSAAITAGVAPLLFVQILYQREFYTANLLLAWRWVIVVPVLIVAFYLLYVSKSFAITRWAWPMRVGLTGAIALFFAFVGFCWTANFLLAISEPEWPAVYLSGRMPFPAGEVVLRMLVWGSGALVSMATILGWQLAGGAGVEGIVRERSPDQTDVRTLSSLAIAGLIVATACGAVYISRSDATVREAVLGPAGGLYLVLAAVGVVGQLAGWFWQWRRGIFSKPLLALATAGWVVALVSVSAIREISRTVTLDMVGLFPRHLASAEVGGLFVFVGFAIVNFASIAGCVWLVRNGCDKGILVRENP